MTNLLLIALGVIATPVANALGLSTRIVRTAVRDRVFDSAGPNDGHGFDAAGRHRGPTAAADGV